MKVYSMKYLIIPIQTMSVMGNVTPPPEPVHPEIWFDERPLRGDEITYPSKDGGEIFKGVVLGIRHDSYSGTHNGTELLGTRPSILIGRNL